MAAPLSPRAIRTGLVGFGTACSIFHAPLLKSSGKFLVTHVLERSTEKSRVLEPAPTIVRSMEALLAADVELIVIATPTSVHFDQAKQAIQAKKHVLVDKPLCVTAEEAQELVDMARTHGVVFSVFQNRRWDSDFLTVRSLVEEKRLGNLTRYEAHFDRYRPTLKHYWKETAMPGAGMLYDLGAHLVDQALQLFGPPDQVQAQVEIQRDGAENDDYFRLEFSYTKHPGLMVVLTAGMLVKEPGPKFILEGTRGKFEKRGEDIQEENLRAGKTPYMDPQWGEEPQESWGTLLLSNGTKEAVPSAKGCYQAFYHNLAEAIRLNAPLLVDPAPIVEQIRILQHAKKNLKKNIQ